MMWVKSPLYKGTFFTTGIGSPVARLDIMSMSRVVDEVLAANRAYSESFGAKGQLGMPPARRFAILTCIDARLDPAKFAGLLEGDAHVIRNAGGSAIADATTAPSV